MMKLLKGERIKLRAIEPSDVDLILDWENDTDNWEVSGTLAPFSREIISKYVSNAHLDIYQAGQLRLMIDELSTGKTIGTIDIFDFEPFHQRAGLGILIANKDNRNNGYASETLKLVVDYCFNHLGLQQLYCNILSDNEISLKLFQKAGFTINGTQKKWIKSGSDFKDQYFLQLLNNT